MLGDFLSTWRRGLVRLIHFIGPKSTAIELETKEGPDAAALPVQQEVIRINAEPNTMLLFRPDCFTHSQTPNGEVLSISTAFLSEQPRWFINAAKHLAMSWR